MSSPPITSEQLAALSPEVRAVVQAIIRHYERRIAELELELASLKKTPRNSSAPPSTQHPHAKPPARKPASKKNRGGQPGHPKHERALIPVEECAEVVTLRPSACRRCGTPLAGDDPQPLRHQVWELPPIQPLVTEYQRHRLNCPGCGESTCASRRAGRPVGAALDCLRGHADGALPAEQAPHGTIRDVDFEHPLLSVADGQAPEHRHRGAPAGL